MITDQYRQLIVSTLCSPLRQANKRTGKEIIVNRTPQLLVHEMRHGLPMIDMRRTYPHTAAAECAWLLSGFESGHWINSKCSLWKAFTDPLGNVPNAYGYRVRHHFGRDQLFNAMQALRKDPTDRRQYVSYWAPGIDGCEGQRNTPCPLGFSLYTLDGYLNMHVTMRSSDLVIGLPTDLMTHALLLDALATDMSLPPGTLAFSLVHAHIYEDHTPMLEGCYQAPASCELPAWSTAKVLTDPDRYVAEIKASTVYHPYKATFNVAV